MIPRCENYDARLSTVTVSVTVLTRTQQPGARSLLPSRTQHRSSRRPLAKRGAEACGVDFSAAQVALARSRYPGLRFEEASADALPFSSDSFDAVVSNFGMPRFPDPDAAMREECRGEGAAASFIGGRPESYRFGAVYAATEARVDDVGLPVDRTSFCSATPNAARLICCAPVSFSPESSTRLRLGAFRAPRRWSRPSCRRPCAHPRRCVHRRPKPGRRSSRKLRR